jgi:hypothetical protein
MQLIGCANPKDDSKKLPYGGVDGSGGNLSFFDQQSMQEWLVNEHPYYVRDLIHRLEQIRKNSPKDFDRIPNNLPLRFLGDSPGEVQKIADKVSYQIVSGSCLGTNGKWADASVSADGRICFSYRSFQNLSLEDLVRKLLTMTMHELSHLRGFSEEDATAWQLAFERTYLGAQTILTFNQIHRQNKDTLEKLTTKISWALDTLIDRKSDSKENACRYLAMADDRAFDLYRGLANSTPSFIVDYIFAKVTRPLHQVEENCRKKSELELADRLASILGSLNGLALKIEAYESPICTGELCVGTRFTKTRYLGDVLLRWQARKSEFVSGRPYSIANVDSVTCQLIDITDNKSVELKKNEQGHYNLEGLYPSQAKENPISLIVAESIDSFSDCPVEVSVELSHRGDVQLLSGTGFSASSLGIRGLLTPDTMRGISVQFAIMDPQTNPPSKRDDEAFSQNDLPYYFRDVYFHSIRRAPKILREFQLNCQLN